MAIEASGEIIASVDRATAFAIVRDPIRLARCIPGCSDVCEVRPDRYTAVLTSRVGFMTLPFKVAIDVAKIDPPAALEATIVGDAVGMSGRVAATARLDLAAAEDHRTTIRYSTEVRLTGRLGGLGEPVLRATSAKMAREFGERLKAEIERGPAVPSS